MCIVKANPLKSVEYLCQQYVAIQALRDLDHFSYLAPARDGQALVIKISMTFCHSRLYQQCTNEVVAYAMSNYCSIM